MLKVIKFYTNFLTNEQHIELQISFLIYLASFCINQLILRLRKFQLHQLNFMELFNTVISILRIKLGKYLNQIYLLLFSKQSTSNHDIIFDKQYNGMKQQVR